MLDEYVICTHINLFDVRTLRGRVIQTLFVRSVGPATLGYYNFLFLSIFDKNVTFRTILFFSAIRHPISDVCFLTMRISCTILRQWYEIFLQYIEYFFNSRFLSSLSSFEQLIPFIETTYHKITQRHLDKSVPTLAKYVSTTPTHRR